MSEQNKTLVTRYFAEMCNGRKLEVANEIFAAGHAYHDPSSPGIGDGPEGMKQLLSTYHRAFPDAHWTVEEMLAVDDTVITRWAGHATHGGELLGIAPTGRTVNVPGIWMQRIADGKIVESWNVWDTLGMLQQLGAVPAFGPAAARAAH